MSFAFLYVSLWKPNSLWDTKTLRLKLNHHLSLRFAVNCIAAKRKWIIKNILLLNQRTSDFLEFGCPYLYQRLRASSVIVQKTEHQEHVNDQRLFQHQSLGITDHEPKAKMTCLSNCRMHNLSLIKKISKKYICYYLYLWLQV